MPETLPETKSKTPEWRQHLKAAEDYYKRGVQESFNLLVYGFSGAGKTRLLKTARRPIVIDSFDPGGTKTIRGAIKEGYVVADTRFEQEDAGNPKAFSLWEAHIRDLERNRVFDNIGTYAIDSLTLWSEALMNEILRRSGRTRGIPQVQDWQLMMNTTRDCIKALTSYPCDLIVTAHVDSDKDEITGKLFTAPLIAGKLKERLPLLFDELYVMQAQETSKGTEWRLLTQPTSIWRARTRFGAEGLYDMYEPPDIKALLKKAGLNDKDKPY